MLTRMKERLSPFGVTALATVLLAAFFLFIGISELINPHVSKEFLSENTRVCITLIAMGLVLLVGVLSPYWGSILLGVCTVLKTSSLATWVRRPNPAGLSYSMRQPQTSSRIGGCRSISWKETL